MGRVEQSVPHFRRAFAIDPNWATLTPRLAKVGILPDDDKAMLWILGGIGNR